MNIGRTILKYNNSQFIPLVLWQQNVLISSKSTSTNLEKDLLKEKICLILNKFKRRNI